MYCTHCASPVEEGAAVCMKCGFAVGSDNKFCAFCGAPVEAGQAVCTSCGQPIPVAIDRSKQKSSMIAGLLALLCGCYGVHNFYLGNTGKAVAQLVMAILGIATSWLIIGIIPLLGASIWALVEGIMLFTGKITTDADGVPLKDSF
ncbi:MAG: TM2 domain-containing protein [Clostridia bacterium]|nr:TM2 domain-containing protein [Clostridia bacterium]